MNSKNVWLNFTDINSFDKNPFIIDHAEGSYVTTDKGEKFLDAISGIWNVALGYSRKDIINKINSALNILPATSLFGRSYPDLLDYSERLIKIAPEFERVFFGTGGSDSIETALKVVQNYWYLNGNYKKKKIGHFDYSYHGVSLGAMNVMGEEPNRIGCVLDETNYFTISLPEEDENQIFSQIKLNNVEEIAAIIIEPIIGSGGIYEFSRSFITQLREFTKANNILLIFDEVVTGFGRTGSMFAYKRLNITPDIIVLAKGITGGYAPLGATLFTSKVIKPFKNKTKFLHGYTNAGSVVGIAAAQAVLDAFENENILYNVNNQSEKIFNKLNYLKKQNPDLIKNIRGRGLMIGIQLVPQVCKDIKEIDYFYELLAKEHILSRSAYQNVVVLMPPLTSDDHYIEDLLIRLENVINAYGKRYRK